MHNIGKDMINVHVKPVTRCRADVILTCLLHVSVFNVQLLSYSFFQNGGRY